MTAHEISEEGVLRDRVSAKLNRCVRPYRTELTPDNTQSQYWKLGMLWSHSTLMQTYQAEVTPYAPHLTVLAGSWKDMSLPNRAMNNFAHAMSGELRASLNAAPMLPCAFARAIGRHHYSYDWAKSSTWGVATTRWWQRMNRAQRKTVAFWHDNYPSSGLFTSKQLGQLANIPGELS